MKIFYLKSIFTLFITYNISFFPIAFASTFKDGILTISSRSLETKTPKHRKDLNFNLKIFNNSHLSKILSKRDAIRFERRIGFGAPLDRVKLHINKTRKEAVDEVVKNLKKYNDDIKWPYWTKVAIPTSFMEEGLRAQKIHCEDRAFLNTLKNVWLEKLSSSKIPQFERLAIFWLNHFSVNFNMYKQKHSFFEHLKFIRSNANKSFINYLEGVLEDPAMIIYLNNEKSSAHNPNENLAREFFELFSLGEGNYLENDIKNFARHISGNSINFVTEKFKYYPYKTSTNIYSAFGKKYNDNKDFFRILKEHPSFGELIAKKFYKEYVELEEPSKEDLAFLVTYFKKFNYEIPEMLRATLYLEKFWEKKLTLIKSPLDLFYGTARTLKYSGSLNSHVKLINNIEESSQSLFNPPNIAGWPSGKEWLSGQRLEKRIKLLRRNFSNIPFKNISSIDMKTRDAIKKPNSYNENLKKFFSVSSNNQLSVETILLGYIPKDFATRKYAKFRIFFYNVNFLGKHWKGIELVLGTDKNYKRKYKNRFTFYDGRSFPQIITNWDTAWFSKWRATRALSSSFPLGPKMERFYNQSKETQKLLYNLLLSAEHVLKNQKVFYTHLYKNKAASKFLQERVNQVKKILKINDNGLNTRMFAYPVNGYYNAQKEGYNLFDCGVKRYGSNFIYNFQSKSFTNFLNFEKLKRFNISLSQLLIPDLNLNIEDHNYLDLLVHEGYQLK